MLQDEVKIDWETHTYTDKQGEVYQSVTRFIGLFHEKFDKHKIAPLTAKKRKRIAKEESLRRGVSLNTVLQGYPEFNRGITKEEVIREWHENMVQAQQKGTLVHDTIEQYLRYGFCDNKEYEYYAQWVARYIAHYGKAYPESTFYLKKALLAGTSDLPLTRTSSKRSILDIKDFKTNEIKFDSTRIDSYTGQIVHDNRYMFDPISHLEDCNYNHYALQLSTYMYMAETELGFKPGSIELILTPWREIKEPETIKMPYMKREVELMVEYYMDNNMASSVIDIEDAEVVEEDFDGGPAF